MSVKLAVLLLLLCFVRTASAHRLDELLQATIISVDNGQLQASMRLIPGVAVSSAVIADIDRNGNGVFSDEEQRAYAERVLGDLSITLDGTPLRPRLVSFDFPIAAQMREGLGEIHIVFTAPLPGAGRERKLVLQQLHRQAKDAYLVNCTVPKNNAIQIIQQQRNQDQSVYELDYLERDSLGEQAQASWWAVVRVGFDAASFGSLFRLGMRHIAEGTDHLLFLLVLLLPAPLMVVGSRWTGAASVHGSVVRILKVVTAFTLGHSITLALAAWGIVSVPSKPVEVLIAVSILVSAIHALRPIFPGKEAAIAAFFGLIHGLAFAATLSNLGVGGWQRVFGILAFNLGIETMQLIVVAAVMPALVLASRTRAYPFVRMGGAIAAGCAAVVWIGERSAGG